MARNLPYVNVSFDPGVRSDMLVRAEMRTGQGVHEIAILDFWASGGNIAPPDGSRVVVTWGANPKWGKTFYGYVNHSERNDNSAPENRNAYRLYCLGTAKPMNATNPDRWSQVTDSFVARSLGERYALRTVLSKGSNLINWVQSTGESDFATLARLAKQNGRCFWVSGPTLNFVDPSHRIVTAASGTVQTFQRTAPAGDNPDDNILEIHLVRGADAPGSDAQVTTAYGLDSASGGLLKATSTRSYTNAGLAVPASTGIYQGVVQSGAEGAAVTSNGTFAATWSTLIADVLVTDVPVNVGDVVNIAGNGIGTTEQGLWFLAGTLEVLEYHDDAFGYDYTANITLTRNQNDTHVMKAIKNLTGSNPVVPAVWVSNKWQAQRLETVYV